MIPQISKALRLGGWFVFSEGDFVSEIPEVPESSRGDGCVDCGAPISSGSVGRCKVCGRKALIRSVPDDFPDVVRRLGSQGAARHYHSSLSTVTRWRKELGMAKHQRAKPAQMTYGVPRSRSFSESPLINNRDVSVFGKAAEFLSRFGAVHRCRADGSFDPKGDHWRRNYRVLNAEQLMHYAVRLGFRYEYPIGPDVPVEFDTVAIGGVRLAAAYFGMSRRKAARIKLERCPSRRGRFVKAAPYDLTERVASCSLRTLAAHYHVNRETVARWLVEAGISISHRKNLGRKLA